MLHRSTERSTERPLMRSNMVSAPATKGSSLMSRDSSSNIHMSFFTYALREKSALAIDSVLLGCEFVESFVVLVEVRVRKPVRVLTRIVLVLSKFLSINGLEFRG